MYVAGLDVGTTGSKIAVFDSQCNLIDVFYKEYDVNRQGGNHEIDFNVVLESVLEVLKKAASAYKIESLGVTSFGETFVMLDENDNALAPSMLYTDPRGQEESKKLSDIIGEEKITLKTGTTPHAMYSISKLMWHKNNNPELLAKCQRVLLGEDFIIYSLTGNAQIDYSLAARTGAFDIENLCYDQEIFDAAGIDMNLMSKPVVSGTSAGVITQKIKDFVGIDYDITIVNGCHDQIAAMIGAGVFSDDTAMDGTGTVECIPVIFKNKPMDLEVYRKGYSVVPYLDFGYACYALSFTGGATLKWFRDNFAELENAQANADGKNVYGVLDSKIPQDPTGILVLPHFAGAATPYMDNNSKAAFLGITLETTKFDIYKALMEGTSYEMLLNFNELRAFTGDIKEIRATGGGASSDVWLQIKADILGMDVSAIEGSQTGIAGSAALAGAAVGVYESYIWAIEKMAKIRKTFTPNPAAHEKYASLYKKYAGLYNAVKEVDNR